MRQLILVVEDDADLRETLLDVLDRAGFDVVMAADGREALATLEAGPAPRWWSWTCTCP